jgi:hypothetical protein
VAAYETLRIPICKPMSAMAFTSMLQAGKVSGTGGRELKKYLRAHLDIGFCPTRQSVDMLADGDRYRLYVQWEREGRKD